MVGRTPNKLVNSRGTKNRLVCKILQQSNSSALYRGSGIHCCERACQSHERSRGNVWLPIAVSRGHLFKELKNVASHRQRKAVQYCRTAEDRDTVGQEAGYSIIVSAFFLGQYLLSFTSSSRVFTARVWKTARKGSRVAHGGGDVLLPPVVALIPSHNLKAQNTVYKNECLVVLGTETPSRAGGRQGNRLP